MFKASSQRFLVFCDHLGLALPVLLVLVVWWAVAHYYEFGFRGGGDYVEGRFQVSYCNINDGNERY